MLEFDVSLRRGGREFHYRAGLKESASGIFGPSGAGKTTLLRILAGFERSVRGQIAVDGTVLFDSESGRRVAPHRRRIVPLWQTDRLFPHYSVLGNLRYAERHVPRGAPRLERADVVDRLGLGPLLNRSTRRLSGGERRRLALGRALLAAPEWLLLDEPFTGMDALLRAQVMELIEHARAKTGMRVLTVSHQIENLLRLSNDVLLVCDGRVSAHGAYGALLEQPGMLARQAGFTNLLRFRVHESDPSAMTTLAYPLGDAGQCGNVLLTVPYVPCPRGSLLHFALSPQDIFLARGEMAAASLQNQMHGNIRKLVPVGNRVHCLTQAGTRLLVDLARPAVERLSLEPGMPVCCLFSPDKMRLV